MQPDALFRRGIVFGALFSVPFWLLLVVVVWLLL